MRLSIISLLCLAAALAPGSPAAAGPIRVGIQPAAPIAGPILVHVYGHYASIHNGTTRHWLYTFVPAGERRFIALGPVNPLLNMGVSVRIYHPEILAESARSYRTPLLVRPVSFETFEPRSWRDVMAQRASELGPRPGTPGAHPVFQAVGHLQSFLLEYLPELDERDDPRSSDAALPGHLALLEEIVRYALATESVVQRVPKDLSSADRASYRKSLQRMELEQRVELDDLLHRIRSWLSLELEQRLEVRRFMEQMRHPQRVAEQLMTDRDRARVGDYLAEAAARRASGERYNKATSWIDPTTRVSYRVQMISPSPSCPMLGVTTDLTRVVDADLGEMIHSVKGRFCRGKDGTWSYERT